MTRPSARGAALLATAAGTYAAARVVGTWELYLLAFAFAGLVLIAWAHVLVAGRRLRVTREAVPPQPVAGDPLRLAFRARSGSALPGLQVTLEQATGGLAAVERRVELGSLGPRGEGVATAGPWPAPRGIHHLPSLVATLEDPLGLARGRRRLDQLEIMVPPRLAHLGSCVLLADQEGEGGGGRRLPSLRGSEFRAIRPHYPGEPLNRVDWKATAKTGSLMLRETEDAVSGDVTVLLNGAAPHVAGELPETNFELAVQVAGSVADYVLRTGQAATLLLPEHEWRPVRLAPDARGHDRLLEILAGAGPRGIAQLGPSLQGLLAEGRLLERTRVLTLVVLSLDRGLVRALVALRQEGLRVSVVHVGAASFASAAPSPESLSLGLALSAAGIGYLALGRGDDLAAALSVRSEELRARIL